MSRHSFSASARRRADVFTPASTLPPRVDAPFPQTRFLAQAAALADLPDVGIEKYPRSFDQHGVIEGLAMVELTPREIEIRIGQLIHASLNGRSTAMALEIVRHINALCAHPDDRRSPEARCVLRRLAGYWRRLAWLAVDSESEGNPIPGSIGLLSTLSDGVK